MRIFFMVLIILLWTTMGYSQMQSYQPVSLNSQVQDYRSACEKECNDLVPNCPTFTECRIAKQSCSSSCMQRMVWEKVANSLDRFSDVIEKQMKEKEEQKTAEADKNKEESEQKTLTSSHN